MPRLTKPRPTIAGAVLEVALAVAVAIVLAGAYRGWFKPAAAETRPPAQQENAGRATTGSLPS